MRGIWPSSKFDTLNLGRNAMKRAERVFEKAFAVNVHTPTVKNQNASIAALDALLVARQSAATLAAKALKRLDQ